MADKIATREAYGNALAEFGAQNNDIVVLDADLAEATKTCVFKKKFPERFFDCGIAENNMFGVAAGLATTGKIPFASTFAMFAAGRSFDQVRNSIGYPHLNVKICATHGGVSVGEDGATHQCCEDMALMRTIPGMVVMNPSDAVEARCAVEAAIKYNGPVYIRFGRLPVSVINDNEDYKFEIGKGVKLADGNDVTIVANGLMVEQALIAREILRGEGILASVVNIHTIKPIDKELLIAEAQQTGAIVTTEEHNIIGGLGSAVAEALSEVCPVPVVRHGVPDQFGKSGAGKDLLEYFNLNAKGIVEKVKVALNLKNMR
ncbi:MAG: transketolase family protein [Ruminococcaceae bacterium]|nr:transketolase family protein [Oscillospiraceae bacterium]